ncbi:hypothetical protein F7725_011820, partial [Dissostichus mawsoni]
HPEDDPQPGFAASIPPERPGLGPFVCGLWGANSCMRRWKLSRGWLMRSLLLVTPHRRWIATQQGDPAWRPWGLSSLLLPLSAAFLVSLHLPESLSQKHSTPHFNHAPE